MDQGRKTRLGEKWVCFACSAKFYDMGKLEPLCPKCGKDQRDAPAPAAKPRKPRAKRAKPAAEEPAPPPARVRANGAADSGLEVDLVPEDDLDDLELDDDDELALAADEDEMIGEEETL
jgi:hypothetical protein